MELKQNILDAIGDTPLVRLNKILPANCAEVYVKCEFMNPTGSIKDRIAHYIIEDALKKGLLKPGGTIVENTSGNTGLSLAMVAAVMGFKCVFTMPDKMSAEKINMIKSFGAQVVVTPTDVPGDSPDHYVETAKRIARETPNSFYVNQYHCQANIEAHYHHTGKEIWEQTEGHFDAFVAGTGTGGTISGVGRYLKEKNPDIHIMGVDPIGSVHYDLFYSKKLVDPQIYVVEGIGEDILCEALDFSVVDEMVQTNDKQAFQTARVLIREEGLFCGGSSGAIVYGAIELAKKLGPGKRVVTVLTDSASRYISKFLSDDWMRDHGYLERLMGQKGTVEDLLSQQEITTALQEDTVSALIQKLKDNGISQIPIVDTDKRPLAMVHEVDILKKLQAGEIRYDSLAKEVSNSINGLVTPSSSLDTLLKVFDSDHVAVVVKDEKLVGILSKIDVIDFLMGTYYEKG